MLMPDADGVVAWDVVVAFCRKMLSSEWSGQDRASSKKKSEEERVLKSRRI